MPVAATPALPLSSVQDSLCNSSIASRNAFRTLLTDHSQFWVLAHLQECLFALRQDDIANSIKANETKALVSMLA